MARESGVGVSMRSILELKVPTLQEQTVLLRLSSIHHMDDLTPNHDIDDEQDPLLAGFAVRLQEVVQEKGLERNQALYRELAKRFGIGPKGVEKWFLAKSWPRNSTMIGLAEWAGVTIDWLMSGVAPKHRYGMTLSEPIARVATVMQTMAPAQQYLAARLVDQVAEPAEPEPNDHGGNNGTHGR